MRLLHVDTMEFHEFPDTRTTPPYAILSHVWRHEEVLFHHMSKRSEAQKMRGFEKIRKCCEVAAKAGYDLVWIDTCCIDKTSSSELSEAINSMFAWYRNSDLCYAYLDDVSYNNGSVGLDFSRSKWFSRGWTLQELIAPKKVVFLSADWRHIGMRTDLADYISDITHVDCNMLTGLPVAPLSAAQRLSWAARRETTREEDRAYSLLGLFGINMPTIYGEAKQAFVRLQLEMITRRIDHSIFMWDPSILEPVSPHAAEESERYDLLADDPSRFAHCSSIITIPYETFIRELTIANPTPQYSVTNYGISIQLPIRPHEEFPGHYLAALACMRNVTGDNPERCCLLLERISGTPNGFRRIDAGFLPYNDTSGFFASNLYLLYARPSAETMEMRSNIPENVFVIDAKCLRDEGFTVEEIVPRGMWEIQSGGMLHLTIDPQTQWRCCGVALIRDEATGQRVAMVLGAFRGTTRPGWFNLMMHLLVEDDSEVWSTRPSDHSGHHKTARDIWQRYRLSREPCGRFHTTLSHLFQLSKSYRSGFIHLTIDIPPLTGVSRSMIVALRVEPTPSKSLVETENFTRSVLRELLRNDPVMRRRLQSEDEFEWNLKDKQAFNTLLSMNNDEQNLPTAALLDEYKGKERDLLACWGATIRLMRENSEIAQAGAREKQQCAPDDQVQQLIHKADGDAGDVVVVRRPHIGMQLLDLWRLCGFCLLRMFLSWWAGGIV